MRRRYIAVRIDSDQPFDERDLYTAVWTSILRLFGEYGASQADLSLVECDTEKRHATLRCSHKALDLVKASIVAMRELGNGEATVHILLVSGTLRSVRNKIQKLTKEEEKKKPE